jgi:hypothetical protein
MADGIDKTVEEAWETYLKFPTLENARAYDEAVEAERNRVGEKEKAQLPSGQSIPQ